MEGLESGIGDDQIGSIRDHYEGKTLFWLQPLFEFVYGMGWWRICKRTWHEITVGEHASRIVKTLICSVSDTTTGHMVS